MLFPVEVRVHLPWENGGEVRFQLTEDCSIGDLVTKVVTPHSENPLEYIIKYMAEVNGPLNLLISTTLVSTLALELGPEVLTRLYLKKERRPSTAVLSKHITQLRQALPGSVRLKGIELKLSNSLLDLDLARKSIHLNQKLKHTRRFSEPANLSKFAHTPLNPLVLKTLPTLQKKTLERLEVLRKARSYSFGNSTRKGPVLKKKSALRDGERTFDAKPPVYMDNYFLCVKLPNDNYVTVPVSSSTILEEVLKSVTKKKSFLLQKNEIAAEKYTFEIPGTADNSSFTVEMDRPLGFYHNPKVLSLIVKEKKYSTMYVNENGKDVMILKFVNGKFQVMAATKEKCIERVSDDERTDKAFREILLLTYRSFMTPEEFLDQLQDRYNCIPPENATEEDLEYFEKGKRVVRENIFYLIKEWCKWYYHDFAVSDSLRRRLREFVSDIVDDLANMDEVIRVQCAELPKLINHMTIHYDQVFNTVRNLNKKSKPMDSMVRKVKPSILAEQLCFWDQKIFKNISSIEFLNQIWKDPEEKEYHSPNLTFFIQRFEKESYWIATEICTVTDLSKRIFTLKRFIELTKECLDRNNLFSLFSLLAGLNLTPVQRLKKTWAGIGKAHQKMHQDLEKLSDPSKNMQAYRTRSANALPPVIPFLPIFLKDMIFFNDGNPNTIQGGLINIEKLRMMTEQIKALTLMAHVPYKYQEDTAIQNYIQNPRVESLKALMELSDQLEPRDKKQ